MMETSGKVVKIFIKEAEEDFYDETVNVVLDDEVNELAQLTQQSSFKEDEPK